MASLRKRNNRWEVRVRRSGPPTQTKTFTLKADAQQWAREAEIALEKGELLQKPKVSPITLEGAVKRYLEENSKRQRMGCCNNIQLYLPLGVVYSYITLHQTQAESSQL